MRLRAIVQEEYPAVEDNEERKLTRRVGRVHLKQRLGIESDHTADVFGQGRNFFHIENWPPMRTLVLALLKGLGLYERGRRNAQTIHVRYNDVELAKLPAAFDGFTLLQLSDLHLDMNPRFPDVLMERLGEIDYDLCVMTGDFRGQTFGDFEPTLTELARVCSRIRRPSYAILGNHDSIRMVPRIEDMGVTMLLNESLAIARGGSKIYLAGIDDPHYFRVENFEKAAHDIPHGAVSILLSHSPEPYRRAAHADFDLMLSGHTHGGQICLPGGIPLLTNADCPRRFCAGAWRYQGMQGYTSVGSGSSILDVRFNCPPEITLHRLRMSSPQ